jgi:phosphocarrier protein HPr
MTPLILTICNTRGLHARAAARFVETASAFDATVEVSKDGQTVTGTSIMGLMMLAAAKGTTIAVSASGPDADAALSAVQTLVESGFNEED